MITNDKGHKRVRITKDVDGWPVGFEGWLSGVKVYNDDYTDFYYHGEGGVEFIEQWSSEGSGTESPLKVQYGGSHYKDRAIQPIEYILANDLNFCEGCVVKYVTRWRDKGGIEDLKKAKHYIDFLIENEEKQE